ncbi:hypothetical protein [Cohnella luojiensis]|uniref:Uncharacterized protein n=1 Tax=Cohnella luojiensis TaxID=652876 RepID=A0A4Y8LSQ1_9BACL|nr:hypothetical protein [Cohnella luojiensis]TFE24533.1 hypothetical protein E2980_15915 [Cohnella luojiensis]
MSDSIRPEWYGRLADGPIRQAAPSISQLQAIMKGSIHRRSKRKLIWSITIATAVLIMLIASGIYGFYEDRRSDIKQATIPQSTEWFDVQHAVENFRRFPAGQMDVQHVVPVSDGVLVFYQRFFKENETDISVEYMRKTIWGWKWIHGGGMSASYGNSRMSLFFEYHPSPDVFLHTRTPFPILYGTIVGEATKVMITGRQGFKVEATAFPSEKQIGWFAYLPESAGNPINIQAIGSDGRVIEEKSLDTKEYTSGIPKASEGTLGQK